MCLELRTANSLNMLYREKTFKIKSVKLFRRKNFAKNCGIKSA